MAKRSETKIAEMMTQFYQDGLDHNRKWLERARENLRMVVGNQWASEDLSVLDSQGRPHLTINRILPIVMALSGTQRQNREDLVVFARRGGGEDEAAVLTELAKHAADVSRADWQLSFMFTDGLVTGKGWVALDIDYQNDPLNGDLLIEKVSPFEILEDRETADYDLDRRCRFIIRTYLRDREELELLYPKRKRDLEVEQFRSYVPENEADPLRGDEGDTYRLTEGRIEDEPRLKRRKMLVRETWWKDWRRVTFLVDAATLEVRRVQPDKMELAKALRLRDPQRWRIVERVAPVLMQTVTTGDVVLEHVEDPFHGCMRYPFTRFTPYLFDDNLFGVVDNLIDPQIETNKRRSQTLHLINTSANSGFIGDRDALTAAEWDDLADFGSAPGQVIRVKPGSRLERLQPIPIHQGLLELEQIAGDDMKQISGVNADLLGLDKTRAESGRAMMLRHRQGLVVNEPIFDNLRYSMVNFYTTLVDLIRQGSANERSFLYSDEEIAAIISERHLDVDLAKLRSFAFGRYGVKITQSDSHPLVKMMKFEALAELARAGVPINPRFLIEASGVPNSEEIIADLQAQQQAAQQAAQGMTAA